MLRRFVALVSALSVAVSPLLARAESIHGAFVHGVASGDPTSDSVVIWTRVTPTGRDYPGEIDPDATARFDVAWTVSTAPPTDDADAGIGTRAWDRAAVQTGAFDAGAETDWCVKVEVRRLTPHLRYHYAFETIPAPGRGPIARSAVGTFTLPPPRGEPYPAPGASSSGREISSSSSESSSSLKFAVFSCSSWAWGRFHAYDAAWRGWGENLTAWLHLGDYYYEYGPTHYPSADEAVPDRWASLFPRRETVTLDDYRRRHATHRSDPSLQNLSAAAPLLAMWDDHEIANDPWVGGAEDHQEGAPENEGDWEDRKVNALRAYHEWLPTRVGLDAGKFSLEAFTLDELRSYERVAHFGDVASVAILETRVGARTETDAQPGGGVFANATRRFAGGGGGGERGGGSTGSAEDASFLAPARWDEDPPGLQSVASEFAAYRDALDAYAERDGAAIVGEAQLAWLAGEMLASKDAGVAWQVVAQASPTVDGASPDLEKGAAALDAAGETEGLPPPYRTWREALEAWTDWRGESEDSGGGANAGSEKKSVGRSGISPVPAASARAALALGKYRVNWNFDDWRGYAKERRRLYESVLPNARRAMVLGGDSHDAWAGTVSADARDWNPARGYSYDSSAHPRTPTGDESVDRRSGADDLWAAVEFDVPGVTPPGAHERAFPWLPFELSDAGHLAANAPTMRFAKSGRRGFALVTFETGASKRATATFVATPEVREETYAAKCLGAFEAAADDGGGFRGADAAGADASGADSRSVRPLPLRLREIACPPLPAALPRGDDANLGGMARASGDRGSSSSELASVAVICAVVGGVFGFNWPFGRGGGGDASGRRRNAGSRTVGGRRYRAFEREDDDPEVELEGAGVVAGYGSAGSDENPENPGSRRRRTAA